MTKLNDVINTLKNAGAEAYYVGGYVRDEMRGVKSNDIDIEVFNMSAEDLYATLSQFGKVDLEGESFGVMKLEGLDVDFTLPRVDSKAGDKHHHFNVSVNIHMTPYEATLRRDLTINALMKNVITGEVLDFHGGLNDLENKVVRCVDTDKFAEDVLRPLRAARFASRFGFTLDNELIKTARKVNYEHLPTERITSEIEKILLSDKPSIGFNAMLEMGVIEQLFPELFALVGCEQNPKYHPEGDAWAHTMNVLDGAAAYKHHVKEPMAFMYSALLHDIGKPATTVLNAKGNWTSVGHELAGADLVTQCMARFTKTKSYSKYIKKMVRFHMVGHNLTAMRKVRVRRIVVQTNMYDLLYLFAADNYWVYGTPEEYLLHPKHTACVAVVTDACDGKFTIDPAITSKDLFEAGYEPGVEFGRVLCETFSMQVDLIPIKLIKRKLNEKVI